MQEVQNIQGMQQPYANTGTALNLAGSQPNISQYFGAESEGVMNELGNLNAQQMAQATGNWQQQAGGVGADRIAVAQSQLGGQQALAAGQTLSQIMQNAVSQSQAGAGLEQSAGNNIANIGTGAQTAALQGTTAELQSGTLAQQQLQNQQNAAYENVLQQISWPFQTNQYLGSMAAGVTPAMGGTGITSGNTKSSMMNSSGIGKGLGLMAGGLSEGGSVPWMESPNLAPEEFELGGGVNPLDIGSGRAPPLHRQAGGFTPASGQTIMVPFGPDFGGSQPLTLNDSGPIPAPNIHPGNFQFPTTPSGMENTHFGNKNPSFENPFLGAGSNNPFAGIMDSLMQERTALMSSLPGASTGMGGWGSTLPSMAGAWGAQGHHDAGGAVEPLPLTPFVFGQGPAEGGHRQKQSSGTQVGNLLGQGSTENPSASATVIPQTTPQGHASPWQQWAMQYRGPNPQGQGQPPAPNAADQKKQMQGLRNLFGMGTPNFSQDAPPQPSDQTMNAPGAMLAAPGAGKDDATPPLAAPGPQSDLGFDMPFAFAADGGAIDAEILPPIHMDNGGNPFGMADPYTNLMGYGFESQIQNQANSAQDQPFQMAGLTMSPASGLDQGPVPYMPGNAMQPGHPGLPPAAPPTPFTPQQQGTLNQANPNYTGPSLQGGQGQPGVNAPDFKPYDPSTTDLSTYYGKPGYPRGTSPSAVQPTPPLSIPTTQAEGREQDAIRQTVETITRPPASQMFNGAPGQTQAPGGAQATLGQPLGSQQPGWTRDAYGNPVPPAVSNPNTALLQTPVGQLAKQVPALAPYADHIPDANMPAGQWMQAHPDLAARIKPYLPANMQAAMQPPAQAQPAAAQSQITRPDFTGQTGAPVATRTNNPFNQWPSAISQRFGGTRSLGPMNGGRDNPAVFPDAVSGAAAGFALMGSPAYAGKTVEQAIYKWAAGTNPAYPQFVQQHSGVPMSTKITPEFLASPQGLAVMKAMAQYENGTQRGPYPLSDQQWQQAQREGLSGAAPTGAVSRETFSERTASEQGTYPAKGTAERTAAPPGYAEPSKAKQALWYLATGDPGAAYKLEMQRFGMYEAAAQWDAVRAGQYGDLTPQQAGVKLADDLTSMRKIMGEVDGQREAAGAPGTLSSSAAAGQTPHGATMTPAAQPTAAAATTAAPPMTRAQEAQARAEMLAASGNPAAMQAGNAALNAAAQRKLIEAQTANVGWQQRGNVMVNPAQGTAFIPGRGVVPMNQLFGPSGGPSGAPSPSGAAPAGGPSSAAPPFGAPSAAPGAPPLPSGGQPTPLPTGAGPETMQRQPPAATQPQAAAQPVAQDRAFSRQAVQPPNGQWPVDVDPADVKKLRTEAQEQAAAATQNEQILHAMETDFERLGGAVKPGYLFEHRVQIMTALNTAARLMGQPGIAADELGSAIGLNKLQTQLSAAQVKGMGREPGYILQMLRTSMIPNGAMTPEAFHGVVSEMHALNQRALDHATEMDQYAGTYGTLMGFEQGFVTANPAEKYSSMAELGAARGPRGEKMSGATLDAVRRNPSNIVPFAQAWHVRPEALQWAAQR